MHIDGAEPVRIHNLRPFDIDGTTYIIGSVLPIGLLRDAIPSNVLIAYLVSGRIRPANTAASRYPHGGMDANVAAVWALGSSPTDFAFNAPLAHRPAGTTTTIDTDVTVDSDDDLAYEIVDVEPDTIEPDVVSGEPPKRRPGRPRKVAP